MNKTILLFLLLCLNAPEKKEVPVKIVSSTEQPWFSGATKPRTGITYKIKALINTDSPIEFKNMWIGKQNVPFNLEYYTLTPHGKLNKGDSVLLVYNRIYNEEVIDSIAKRLPIQYNGEALIEYLHDKSAHHLIVKSFTKLPALKGE